MVYWFMLLAFSSALAGFSIATRVGAACAGSDLSSSAFCKRSTLGGVIGIICALLACAALVLYRMDKGGIFDIWGSKRKSVVLRINALLACLALILQSVNMGFGTNMSGPSTDINNTCITSYMGTILSLLLCEQAKNRSLLRLLPPPPVRVEKVVEETNLSGGDLGNIDGDNPYSSSSSNASSCAASSELAESFESSVLLCPLEMLLANKYLGLLMWNAVSTKPLAIMMIVTNHRATSIRSRMAMDLHHPLKVRHLEVHRTAPVTIRILHLLLSHHKLILHPHRRTNNL